MAVVFKAVSFGAAGRKRQNRIQAIQRLDGTLFVDTEHRGAQWWLEVQANDIGRLLFKLRIGAGHVAAQSMGLDLGPRPHASNPAVRNAQMSSQLSGAPMSRTIGRGLFSRLQNPGFLADDLLRDNLATMPRIQTRQAFFNKSRFPPRYEVLTTALLLTDGSIRLPSRELKDYLRTPHFSCLHGSRSCHFSQFPPLMRRQPQPCR